ncbi:hypothetical protein PR048_006051 [Dryococelus australis]|uniref:Uncharacterized protein n=1 Tax=Dryococelus australis TaxID=614101 RepID=A0ABQ9IC24_9NEOP|nr:hypothetical protein PR048_006051 [Dryococelus australis]
MHANPIDIELMYRSDVASITDRSFEVRSAHSNAHFRMFEACSMHGARLPDALMSQYSLHVNSMAFLALPSSARSLVLPSSPPAAEWKRAVARGRRRRNKTVSTYRSTSRQARNWTQPEQLYTPREGKRSCGTRCLPILRAASLDAEEACVLFRGQKYELRHVNNSLPGFSHVGTGSDNAAGRRIFSGISRLPRPYIPVLLHVHFISSAPALNTSLLRANHVTVPGGKTGDPLENLLTSGIVQHNSLMRISESVPARNRTRFA